MARSSLVCSIWQRYDFIPNIRCYQPEKSADPKEAIPVTFKIRHTPEFIRGKLLRDETGCLIVSEEKLQGIAPGQFGVVYDEAAKLCIGSGEIRYSTPPNPQCLLS